MNDSISPGGFDTDFELVYRAPKRDNTTIEEKTTISKKEYMKSTGNGLKILTTRRRQWEPTFIPGVSATPNRDPLLNIPKHLIKDVEPKVLKHIESSVFGECLSIDTNRPLSPHQYSSNYFTDTHALKINNSLKRYEILKNKAEEHYDM